MKNILFAVILSGGLVFASCNNQPEENKVTETATTEATVDTTAKFTSAMVDNKKDPSCGMPVSAGIEDTVHYKGKVLGFCSKDCKDDFLKNPEKNIAAADLKK